ncbi:unnamed protein product [Calicophoron daubneyi]|uniref:Uncharacterized protein n=1 Tax=Calicophoron daubneyi TaxID=300641 RepID=A0AAV2THG3_CALDB
MRPCCCLMRKLPPPETVRCTPQTGELHVIRRSYRFNRLKRICEVKAVNKRIPLVCQTKLLAENGKCDVAKGIALDRILRWVPNLSLCRCDKVVDIVKRLCSCKHLDRTSLKPVCLADKGLLIKERVKHTLRGGRCQSEQRWLVKQIVCPKGEKVKLFCNPQTCDEIRLLTWSERVGCHCSERTKQSIGKCCCPAPQEVRICSDSGHLLSVTRTSYQLNPERSRCTRLVRQTNKVIACAERDPYLMTKYCDRQICHPVSVLRQVKLKECRCVNMIKKVVHAKIQCCCPPPRFITKCYDQYGVISRIVYRYELFKDHCITRKFVDQDKIVCPKERIVRETCNKVTGLRPILRHIYYRHGCECRMKLIKDEVPCVCPSPRIVKEPCTPNSPTRRVLRVWFELNEDVSGGKAGCYKKVAHLSNEPCQCAPTKTTSYCRQGKLVSVRVEDHMSLRNSRPVCLKKVFVKKVPVSCNDKAVHVLRKRCTNYRREVITVEDVLNPNTCKCQKAIKKYVEACDCSRKNTVRKQCQNVVSVITKELYSSRAKVEKCIKVTTRSVHPVVCSQKPEVIKSSGCTIRKPQGIYQAEEVRWEVVINCQCVVRRKQMLRLCACPEPTVEKICLDTVNLAVYRNTFTLVGDQCLPNQEVVTREIRCRDQARIISKSACEATTGTNVNEPECVETIQLSMQYAKNCKCHNKIIRIRRRCCAPEADVTRVCDVLQNRWIVTKRKYTLVPDKVLFEVDGLVIRDRVVRVTREQRFETVVCPQTKIRENCDRQTGLLTRTTTRFEIVQCVCKAVRVIERGRCKCPPPRTWETECKRNFLHKITEMFDLVDGKCVLRRVSKRVRCACPKAVRRIYCDGEGRWVKCYTRFIFNSASSACRLVKHCIRWQQECSSPRNRLASKCDASTGFRQTVQKVRFRLDRKTCHCLPTVLSEWKEYCRCDQLNRKFVRCQMNTILQTRRLVHQLVNGECIPREVEKSQLIVCPKTVIRFRPCDRNPRSTARGLMLKTVESYVANECQCIRKIKLYKKICDCNLLHKPALFRRCRRDNQLQFKRTFWTFYDNQCIPGAAIYSRDIRCVPDRRVDFGPCVIGSDGIGRQQIRELQLQPVRCACAWVPVHKSVKICKCPEPTETVECIESGRMLLRTTTTFVLESNTCQMQRKIRKEDPCRKLEFVRLGLPMVQRDSCNTQTCMLERTDYRTVVTNCHCRLQRKRSLEPCCCPGTIRQTVSCIKERNELKYQEKRFELMKPRDGQGQLRAFCQPVLQVRTVRVRCSSDLQRILVKRCDGQYHHIRIMKPVVENCMCKEHTHKYIKIRCGCPPTLRYIRGKCMNQWAEDKWMGLRAVPAGYSQKLKLTAVTCQPYVLRKHLRRCACPKPVKVITCEENSLLSTVVTNYRLNSKLNNCEKIIAKKVERIICPTSQIQRTDCTKESNFEQTEVVQKWELTKCKCVLHVQKSTWICDCSSRYPQKQTVTCLLDGQRRLTEIRRMVNSGRKCKSIVSKRIEQIECEKSLRVVKGECDAEEPNRRRLVWMQQKPVNCICKWRPLSASEMAAANLKTSEACRCPAPYQVNECLRARGKRPATWRKVRVHYLLRNGECRPYRRTELFPVKCNEGLVVHRGACNPVTNTRTVKRIVSKLKGCNCKHTVFKRQCHCAPPPSKHLIACHHQTGLLRRIKTLYEMDEDRCLYQAKYFVQTYQVICDQTKTVVGEGPCLPRSGGTNGDRFKRVTWSSQHRVECRCITKHTSAEVPCFCDPQKLMEKKCIEDRILETVVSERRISADHSKCIRIPIGKFRRQLHLGKPENLVRCNLNTGVETVTQTTPYIANCKRGVRVRKSTRRCKCASQPRLFHKTACKPDCTERLIWRREVLTEAKKCKALFRIQTRACCCPADQQLKPRCNGRDGILIFGTRSYLLRDGVCIIQEKFTNKVVVCSKTMNVKKRRQPNGWLRVEKHFVIRDQCQCVPKMEVTFDKWKCPAPTTRKRCVKDGQGRFILESISTKWEVSKIQPVCGRFDTVVSRIEVDCSAQTLIPVEGCRMNAERNAAVRKDQLLTQTNDGCRCVPNKPKTIFHVCWCIKTKKVFKCNKLKGLLLERTTKYERSGDGSSCLPYTTNRLWKPVCSPLGPRCVGKTKCDPETGLLYHLYEENKRKDCQCVKRRWRVPARCKCPKAVIETKCIESSIREKKVTKYDLLSNGICLKSTVSQREVVRCKISHLLVASNSLYQVERPIHDPKIIRHVFSCGSAGQCLRRVREFLVYVDEECKCQWKIRETSQACCCPTGLDQVASHKSRRLCDVAKGILIDQRVEWKLHEGRCRQVLYQQSTPIICDRKIYIKPTGLCEDRNQPHLIRREKRVGCKCIREEIPVVKRCLCDTVKAADIIFVVDESCTARQPKYSDNVKSLLKRTIKLFTSSTENPDALDEYRFGLLKYSANPSIVFGLQDHGRNTDRVLAHVDDMILNGVGSYLGKALHLLRREMLPRVRGNVPVLLYLINDGNVQDWQQALHEAEQLRQAGIRMNVIAVGADEKGIRLLARLVSSPTNAHLFSMQTSESLKKIMNKLVQSMCVRNCPPNRVVHTPCSVETACIGRTTTHKYVFDEKKGRCVGKTTIEIRRCCCLQKARNYKVCENNRLILVNINWQLTPEEVCAEFMVKRDITGPLLRQCSPALETRMGRCQSTGHALKLEVRRTFVNCKCKVVVRRRIVPCRCDRTYTRTRCFGDDTMVREVLSFKLVNEQCLRRKAVTKRRIVCPQPVVVKSACDTMTCQRRVTIVQQVPQKCQCQRKVQVKYEVCCCHGQRTIRYEGCKHNVLKVFVEKTTEPILEDGACVKRTRYHIQPVECPKNPSVIRHPCRRASDTKSGDTVDPAVMYRQVEKVWWEIKSCECRKQRRVSLEACGCDQTKLAAESGPVYRCNEMSGVIMMHVKKLYLEIRGKRAVYTNGVAITSLSEAKCRVEYEVKTVRKIICPEHRIVVGPCVRAEDGRAYKTTMAHRWSRRGCKCVEEPTQVVQKQLCGCRPVKTEKRCARSEPRGPRNILEVRTINEFLEVNVCKVTESIKKHVIVCPKSFARYSKCVNGKALLTVRMYQVYECRCVVRTRKVRVKCEFEYGKHGQTAKPLSAVAGRPVQPEGRSGGMLYEMSECTDLLPPAQCRIYERPPYQICEKSGYLRDLLCRRTCNKCSACPLERIAYRLYVNGRQDACIVSDRRYSRKFLVRTSGGPVNLARCKLICAQIPDCQSIDYYVSAAEYISAQSTCVLNRVDPAGLRRRLPSDQIRLGTEPDDLARRAARRCFLFAKLCTKACPRPRTTVLTPCICRKLKDYSVIDLRSRKSKKPILLCTQRVKIDFYVQSKSGRCVPKRWVGDIPCRKPNHGNRVRKLHDCTDLRPPLWCGAQIAQRPKACEDPEFREVCLKSCGLCKCRGSHTVQGKCHRSGYALKIRVTYQLHNLHKQCIALVQKRRVPCEFCPVGRFDVIHECDERTGKRDISHVYAKLSPFHLSSPDRANALQSQQCSIRVRVDQVNCANCLAGQSDRQSLVPCRKLPMRPDEFEHVYVVQLITEYMVNVDGCCVIKRSVRSFYCDGCPPLHVSRTPCLYGYRLRQLIFYTRPSGIPWRKSTGCIRRVITQKERCHIPARIGQDGCVDQLTATDCIALRDTGGCRLDSEYARKLCPSTCGFCN